MENNITVNMENLSEEERKQLMKIIKKSNGCKRNLWKPNYGRKYFYINNCGRIMNSEWYDDRIDSEFYKIGNCFKTKEEAEFELERIKVKTELRRFSEENNEYEIDWKDKKQEKWVIFYNCKEEIINPMYVYDFCICNICFTSEEIARQAIKSIGEERLKKYYFGIED